MKKLTKTQLRKQKEEEERLLRIENALKGTLPFNVLAIDPATALGWAMALDDYGTWDLSVSTNETMGIKLLKYEMKLRELIEEREIKAIAFEMPVRAHMGAMIHHAKLNAITERTCAERGVEYIKFTPTELKKFATGKGNSNKDAVIACARETLGYGGNDDNEADALWIFMLLKDFFLKDF